MGTTWEEFSNVTKYWKTGQSILIYSGGRNVYVSVYAYVCGGDT